MVLQCAHPPGITPYGFGPRVVLVDLFQLGPQHYKMIITSSLCMRSTLLLESVDTDLHFDRGANTSITSLNENI